jgi:sterol desaturase/sphingolipid hydroxylase (fatty acid hydroxylase superfamily)
MTDQPAVVHQEEPIRLFRSDFLEFFSHISPWTVALLWTPVVLYFLLQSILRLPASAPAWHIPLGVFTGWFVWTFVEYTIHRFIFHYHPKTEKIKKFFFIMHGIHHAQPMCKTRLVMPPVVSVPLALLFFGLFYLVFVLIGGAEAWLYPAFTGFIGGYLLYDLTHYNIHHSKVRKGFFFNIRKHHLRHHGACDFMRFGVTFPLWDHVFGTMPKAPCQELLEAMARKQGETEVKEPAAEASSSIRA